MIPTTSPTLRELAARYSSTQLRTVDAAFRLFAQRGVGGTSLQMIADQVGVTKAAVYHQFPTKDAIVLAVLEVQLQPLEAALEDAQAHPEPEIQHRLLAGIVDALVTNRRSLATLQSDPVLFRLLGEHPPSLDLFVRIFARLLGEQLDDRGRVRAAVLSAAFGAVAYPFVVGLDDETLRDELLATLSAVLIR